MCLIEPQGIFRNRNFLKLKDKMFYEVLLLICNVNLSIFYVYLNFEIGLFLIIYWSKVT